MRLIYLSYWGINEGLTKASVIPNIKMLEKFEQIEKIDLFTIERNQLENSDGYNSVKTTNHFLISKFKNFRILNKLYDFLSFPNQISRLIKSGNTDILICRGAPAGAIGLLALKKSKIPFIVESFEPHAEYMRESGVWSKFSLSYILEKRWERKIKEKAMALLPVSENYKNTLIKESRTEKIHIAPCAVDAAVFRFDNSERKKLREKLDISKDKTVGIYVGKFGDIYLKDEFFEILKILSNELKEKFHFIILSPQKRNEILSLVNNHNIDTKSLEILNVDHREVPKYLSAADYGLTTVRPSPHRKYCSPIKTGEYWANGLPVLITEGIGDDSDIISQNNIGSLIDLDNIKGSVKNFIEILNSKSRSEWLKEIVPFAKKYRSFEMIKDAYHKILTKIEEG